MSLALVENVPSTISSALNTIEERSTQMHGTTKHIVGPFGVFACGQTGAGTGNEHQPSKDLDDHPSTLSLDSRDDLLTFDSNEFTDHSASLDFLQWDDLFTGDLQLDDVQLTTESFQNPSPPRGRPEEVDLEDAADLLKHFHEDVIQQMGSLPVKEKSGWRILNYNSALVTLGQLRLLEVPQDKIQQASLANLYAVIAVSSLHLSLNPAMSLNDSRPRTYWSLTSSRAYEMSKQCLKMSLKSESHGPNKAKYKEQLMATAAILANAVCLVKIGRMIC